MHDPDARGIVHPGHRRGRRERDRVVATQDDRDRTGAGDAPDLLVDHSETAVGTAGHDRRVARVDHRQDVEGVRLGLERPCPRASGRHVGAPDRHRPEPRARSCRGAFVVRGADDRDVGTRSFDRLLVEGPRDLVEGPAEVRVLRQVVRAELVELVGVVGVEGALGDPERMVLGHGAQCAIPLSHRDCRVSGQDRSGQDDRGVARTRRAVRPGGPRRFDRRRRRHPVSRCRGYEGRTDRDAVGRTSCGTSSARDAPPARAGGSSARSRPR